ncbi:unnamed protein product [Heligmosomoides polygyrus]|uniref:Similar to n=1 Tax=Heligmosomoides polygyrus TaxID=6339 RepID=A0A183GGZ2_HELPZ|nr:unnamed protein product [Heligmosomoides polygyrus]
MDDYDYDLFDDEDNSQSSQPSVGAPISAGFAEKTKNLLMTKDKLPLGKLGLAICQHDFLADYPRSFISYKMGDATPDVEEGRTIAQTLSSVQQPSDLILRPLMNVIADQSNMIVGLTAAVKVISYCLYLLAEPQTKIFRWSGRFLHEMPEAKLPEDTCLAFENLTQVWRIPHLEVQEEWPDISNALFKACEPPVLVKRYAVRISGSCAKRGDLHDFPEQLVEQLIGVCLDGLRLGMRELSCPVSVAALRRNPTPYWFSLSDTNEGREAAFEERKKARAHWTILVRRALQRALYDIRKYVLDANGLCSRTERKIIRVGTEPRTSQLSPEHHNEEDDTAWRKD